MSSATILVACGNSERRDGIVSAISNAGWREVLAAPGMREAVGLARDDPNLCVIVDAELADMPGLKALAILRQVCPRAKIIFASPQNTRELETRVREADVFYYCVGSAESSELIEAVEEAVGPPAPAKAHSRPKVLVVDDDRDYHMVVRATLAPAGYVVVSAYSGPEGLEVARRERPDVIVLDIVMNSTTDGFEFCREARRDPMLKHTPIIGISAIEERMGLGRSPDREPGLFPVDRYLQKPVAAEQLLAELRRLVPSEG